MISLLTGTSAYLVAGTLSITFPRFRFWFSLLGWSGALAGLTKGWLLYRGSGLLVRTLGDWGVLGIEIRLDRTTLLFAALVVLLNLFTLIYLGASKNRTYYILYNFLFATSYSLAFSSDLFNIYVSIELLSLISILLIGYERKGFQIYAGVKYLVLSSLAMSLYLIGLGLVYSGGGHLGITELLKELNGTPSFTMYIGLGLMVTGLAVKGGVFLFSIWLPDAYTYSGTITSTLLAGMATKAGLIGIIRISILPSLNELLLGLGVLTGISGALLAIVAATPKRILAFSSISQVGYILIGLGLGTPTGVLAASLHVFFHGLFKGLLFNSVGHAGVGEEDLRHNEITSLPLVSKFGLVVGSFSMLAIPPFNAYFSKTLLLEEAGHGWVRWVILTIGFGTAIYLLKLNRSVLFASIESDFRRRDLSVLVFALFVSISAIVGLILPASIELLELMSPHHFIFTFSLIFAGGLTLFSIRKKLRALEVPYYLFKVDNGVISVFSGFLFVVVILLLV
jgi:multicomponent Na+:H+ antiporter subunit D